MKELVEKELKDECNDEYDFESAEWKKELKGVVMEVFQKMMERSEADRDASPPPAKKTKKLPSEVRMVCMYCMLCHGGVDTIGSVSG